MKNIKYTLFLALTLAITSISAFAQAPGQIPIVGKPVYEPNKTTATTISMTAELKKDFSSEITDYLWTFVSLIKQAKF